MTYLALTITFFVYIFYIVEAVKAYKNGEIPHRPKPHQMR